MLLDIQLVFIICGNYIRLVETLSKFLDIKKTKGKKTVSFLLLRKNAEQNKIKTNVYVIILVNNSQKRLRDETVGCRFGWS